MVANKCQYYKDKEGKKYLVPACTPVALNYRLPDAYLLKYYCTCTGVPTEQDLNNTILQQETEIVKLNRHIRTLSNKLRKKPNTR